MNLTSRLTHLVILFIQPFFNPNFLTELFSLIHFSCEYFETNARLRSVCTNELGKEKSRQGQKSKRVRDQQINANRRLVNSSGNLQAIRSRFAYCPKAPNQQATQNPPEAVDRPKTPERPKTPNRPAANQLFAKNFKINRVVFVSGSESDDEDDYPKNLHRRRFDSKSGKFESRSHFYGGIRLSFLILFSFLFSFALQANPIVPTLHRFTRFFRTAMKRGQSISTPSLLASQMNKPIQLKRQTQRRDDSIRSTRWTNWWTT